MPKRTISVTRIGEKEDLSKTRTVKIKPPMTENQVRKIQTFVGKGMGCKIVGAIITQIDTDQITISEDCGICGDDLLTSIISQFGKVKRMKSTYLLE